MGILRVLLPTTELVVATNTSVPGQGQPQPLNISLVGSGSPSHRDTRLVRLTGAVLLHRPSSPKGSFECLTPQLVAGLVVRIESPSTASRVALQLNLPLPLIRRR